MTANTINGIIFTALDVSSVMLEAKNTKSKREDFLRNDKYDLLVKIALDIRFQPNHQVNVTETGIIFFIQIIEKNTIMHNY